MTNQAVFLDKDGTLIEDVPYNVNPDLMQLTVGAVEGLRSLHAAGYKLIIISNQSGVARGYFPEEALLAVEERSRQLLAEMSVPLTGFYYCPHHPDGSVPGYNINCSCRKPEPGLILRAAREHDIDLAGSWFIGDILNDVEAGHRAGCKTVLIDNGNETEWILSPLRLPHYIATDLADAARIIQNAPESLNQDTEEESESFTSRACFQTSPSDLDPPKSPLKRGTLTQFSPLFKAGALVRIWGDLRGEKTYPSLYSPS